MDAIRKRLGELVEPIDLDDDVPIDFSRRTTKVATPVVRNIAIIALVVVVGAVVFSWWQRSQQVAIPELTTVSAPASSSLTGDSVSVLPVPIDEKGPEAEAPAEIVVSVVGLVVHPGVVTVAGDARVADAIALAGGMLPEANPASVNLAAKLEDGQQLVVGTEPVAACGGGGGAGEGSDSAGTAGAPGDQAKSGGGKVDINTASVAELETLPGIGPATAKKIVSHRETQGPFSSVDQLVDVPGIGPAKLAGIRDEVVV